MSKTILITGANSGIGKACLSAADRLGWQVFAGVRNPQDVERLAQEYPDCRPLWLDVTQAESIDLAYQIVANNLHPNTQFSLINNAGVSLSAPLELMPITELQHLFNVNVIGSVAVTQTFLSIVRQTSGRIINIGSIAGRFGFPYHGAYCASKTALDRLTSTWRLELAQWQIPVILIEPGSINTPIWAKAIEWGDRLYQHYPSAPIGTSPSLVAPIYQRLWEQVVKIKVKQIAQPGIDPDRVAQTTIGAISTIRPQPRYIVGQDAFWAAQLSKLPEILLQKLIKSGLGW